MEPRIVLSEEHRQRVEEFRSRHKTAVLTLLFTDVVGSTDLKRELGDAGGGALIEQHRSVLRKVLGEFPEAAEINTWGDAVFLVFIRPSEAVRFAVLLQSRLRDTSKSTPLPVRVRIGIQMGEVYVEKEPGIHHPVDILGVQVDLAHRVMSIASASQTLMTCGVFNNARAILRSEELPGVHPLSWLNHGSYHVKGVDDPLEICEVGEEGLAPLAAPRDSALASRFLPPDQEPVLGWRPALGQEVPTSPGWILVEKIGEGGFGEVWKAQHRTSDELRVFKFCFSAKYVRSLKREVTLFQLLKEKVGEDPRIVRIYAVFFDRPPYYIEMEYVPGSNLRKWCADQGGVDEIPLGTRLEIIAQAAEGLQVAHDTGIVHRDVKPTNILIQGSGISPSRVQVRITDFGIGSVISREILAGKKAPGFTETTAESKVSSHPGTGMYMAPEVSAGRPATPQSDLFSLGLVFYQLVSGDWSRPVDWRRNISDSVISEDLERCFADDPHDRFPSARDLAGNIRVYQARREALAREKKARRSAGRRKAVFLAVVFAAMVTAGALLFPRGPQTPEKAPESEIGQQVSAPDVIPEGRTSEAVSLSPPAGFEPPGDTMESAELDATVEKLVSHLAELRTVCDQFEESHQERTERRGEAWDRSLNSVIFFCGNRIDSLLQDRPLAHPVSFSIVKDNLRGDTAETLKSLKEDDKISFDAKTLHEILVQLEQVPPNATPPRETVQRLASYMEELKEVKADYDQQKKDKELAARDYEFMRLCAACDRCRSGLASLEAERYYSARMALSGGRSTFINETDALLSDLRVEGKLTFDPDALVSSIDQLIQLTRPDESQQIPVYISVAESEGSFLGVEASVFEDQVIAHAEYAFLISEIPIRRWPHRQGSDFTCEIDYTLEQLGESQRNLGMAADYTVRISDTRTGESIMEFTDRGEYWHPPPVIILHIDPVGDARSAFDPSCFNFEEHFRVLSLENR